MNTDELKGKWTQVKGRIRNAYAELTEDEVERAKGDREKLEGLLQERYGRTKAQAKSEVEKLLEEA